MSEKQQMSPATEELATYMADASKKPLPVEVLEKTKHHLVDTLAAMISGQPLLPGRRAIAYARSRGGVEEASVVGTDYLTTTENAALANGMLAHSDETDDSHAPSQTHPGCGIVAAALAMAEARGAGGAALLRAVALGYDIGTRFTMALNALEFREEGHSTHSFGPTFGAAAAAGSGGSPRCGADASRADLSPASRRPAWAHGSATATTSRRPSTSGACRPATVSQPRHLFSIASPPPMTCSLDLATSFRPIHTRADRLILGR